MIYIYKLIHDVEQESRTHINNADNSIGYDIELDDLNILQLLLRITKGNPIIDEDVVIDYFKAIDDKVCRVSCVNLSIDTEESLTADTSGEISIPKIK